MSESFAGYALPSLHGRETLSWQRIFYLQLSDLCIILGLSLSPSLSILLIFIIFTDELMSSELRTSFKSFVDEN